MYKSIAIDVEEFCSGCSRCYAKRYKGFLLLNISLILVLPLQLYMANKQISIQKMQIFVANIQCIFCKNIYIYIYIYILRDLEGIHFPHFPPSK